MHGDSDTTVRPFPGASQHFRDVCRRHNVAVSQARRGWDLTGQFASTAELSRWCSLTSVDHGGAGLTDATLRRVWQVRRTVGARACVTTNPAAVAARELLVRLVPSTLPVAVQLVLLNELCLRLLVAGAGRDRTPVPVGEQRSAKSWHLPDPDQTVDGRPVGAIACWPSRRAWLTALEAVLAEEPGRTALRARSVSSARVLAVARVCADHADGATGRHCTVSHERVQKLAKVSESVAKRARRVLHDLGFVVTVRHGRRLNAQEMAAAARHHGGRQSGVASDMSLTVPREIATARAPRDPLPSCGSSRSVQQVPKELTKRARARKTSRSCRGPAAAPRPQRQPVSLEVKRLVAGLVRRCHGLDTGVGRLSRLWRVVAASGIDPRRWSAADVVAELNRDGRESAISWPDRLKSPAAYLAWRLRRIDWASSVPASTAAGAHAGARTAAAAGGVEFDSVVSWRSSGSVFPVEVVQKTSSPEFRRLVVSNWRTLSG